MKIHYTLTACVLAALVGGANADTVNIAGSYASSTEHTGASFDASLEYTYDGGEKGILIVTITNTTTQDIGGFLTGFVFDIASIDSGESDDDDGGHHDSDGHDDDFYISLNTASNNAFQDTGSESANPFGNFDAGAALNGHWTNGGNPLDGLAIGETGVFEFRIDSDDALTLTATDFLGDDGNRFAVRFRGFDNGDSDKLLVVPLPTAALAGLTVLGLGFGARTIRKRR